MDSDPGILPNVLHSVILFAIHNKPCELKLIIPTAKMELEDSHQGSLGGSFTEGPTHDFNSGHDLRS